MYWASTFYCGLVSVYAISCNCVILGDYCMMWSVLVLVLAMDSVCVGICIFVDICLYLW